MRLPPKMSTHISGAFSSPWNKFNACKAGEKYVYPLRKVERGGGKMGERGWGVERETERANDKSSLYVIYQTDQGMGTCKRVFIRQSLNRTLKHTQTERGREVGVRSPHQPVSVLK